jgi:hypothetical protein
MSPMRVVLAALAGFVLYFAMGAVVFAMSPLRHEFERYPAVYRSAEGIKKTMPFGMAAMLLAMLCLAALYALLGGTGAGWVQGTRFGALIGAFSVCSFVIHNHVNLNIGWRLTIGQAIAYFVQWTLVGTVIGLVYRRS